MHRPAELDVFDGHAVLALICARYNLEFVSMLRQLLDDAMAGGSWMWAPQLGLEWYSTRFLQVLGLEPGKVPHLPELWQERIDPDDRERALALMAEHVRTRGSTLYDLPAHYRRPDGSKIVVRCTGEVVRGGPQGEAHVVMGHHVEYRKL